MIFSLNFPSTGPIFNEVANSIKSEAVDTFVQPKSHIVMVKIFNFACAQIEIGHAGCEARKVKTIGPTAGVPRVLAINLPACWLGVLPYEVVSLRILG